MFHTIYDKASFMRIEALVASQLRPSATVEDNDSEEHIILA